MARFMDTLIRTSPEERFAFLEGIIIASDIQAIRKSYPFLRKRIAILGDLPRADAYRAVFNRFFDQPLECMYLGEQSMDRSALHGALRIATLRADTLSAP